MSRRHVPKIIPKVLQELLLIILGCILINVLQRLLDPDYRLLRGLRLLSGPEFYSLVTICIYLAVAFLIFSLRRLWDLRAKVMTLGVADNLLRQDHRFLQELIDVIPTPVFYKDSDGRYRLCNSAFQETVDLPRNEIIGRTVFDVVPAGLAERYDKMDRAAWTNRTTQFYESRFLSAEGVARDVILTHALHYDEQGEPAGLVGVMTDISDMKRLEVQLKESESLFRTLAQSSLIGVALHDGLSLVYVNNTLEQITGYSRDELLGMQPWELLHPEAKDSLRPIIAVLLKERAFAAVRTEGRIVTRDGRARWIQCYAETVEYDGRNVVLGNFIDITERKELEEKMRVMATVDKLTQSFNRSRLDEILNCEIARVRRYERPLSIIMFDLDHFKKINDTYGHPTGDKVLAMTAEIVKGSIRRTDYLGRWGGEEFLIVLPETSMEAAYDLAEKLRRIVDTYPYDTVESVTASFGVAEFEVDETNFDLLKRVDEALYLAKHRGRNRVEIALQSEPTRQYALPLC